MGDAPVGPAGGPKTERIGAEREAPDVGGGRRFQALLRRRAGAATAAEAPADPGGASVARPAALAPLPREPTLIEHRPASRAAGPAPPVARVLVGQGASAREARLELRGGVLGGAAIHLVSGPGGIEVRLGAPSDAARAALAHVIDRVGLRLRSRGIVMRAGRALDSGAKEGGRGGDARRGP